MKTTREVFAENWKNSIVAKLAAFVLLGGVTRAATIESIDNSSGVDLSGNIAYAVNFSPVTPDVTVDGTTFQTFTANADVEGLTVTPEPIRSFTGSEGFFKQFPALGGDDNLNTVIGSFIDANSDGVDLTEFDMGLEVVSGQAYRLQLLFSEGFFTESGARVFDVSIEGSLEVGDLDPFKVLGDAGIAPDAGTMAGAVVVTHDFVAGDDTLNINFKNKTSFSVLSGLVLTEATAAPAPIAVIESSSDLNLSESIVYAVNFSPATPDVTVDGTTFQTFTANADVAGLTVTPAPIRSFTGSEGFFKQFPALGGDDNLNTVIGSFIDAQSDGVDLTEFDVSLDVVSGQAYRLQMLFSEGFFTEAGARVFDVSIEGSLAFRDFDPFQVVSNAGIAPDAGTVAGAVVVTYDFVAGDDTLDINFKNKASFSVLSGLILTDTSAAPGVSTIGIGLNADDTVTVTWGGGTLQSSTDLSSPDSWTNVPDATGGSHNIPVSGTDTYFRATQ